MSGSRLNLITIFVLVAGVVLGVRLFHKQVIECQQYRAKAARQHITRQEIQAQRGSLYINEQYGEPYPIATNITYYQVLVVPRSLKDARKTARALSPIIGISEQELFSKINNKKLYIPPLKKHMVKSEADKVDKLVMAGVYITPELVRYYPESSMAGHLLGYVDTEGIGNYGLEAYYNEALEGSMGIRVSSRDSRGRKIATIKNEVNKEDGADIILETEHNVQFKAEEVIANAVKDHGADRGSMIVMDTRTGGILAMANVPSYDPNNYSKVAKDSLEIFRNPAISEAWEPGSIMKPLVMGAALDQGLVTPDTTGDYDSCVTVQGYKICTATKKAFGHETMTQVLENSDNVAMVSVGDKLGNEMLFRYLKALGFGEKERVDLQGEAMGMLSDFKKWRDLTRSTIVFGQGMTVTPLQMVNAYAAVANKGVLVKPHVVKEIKNSDGSVTSIKREDIRRVFKGETAAELTQMLISVVEKGHGKRAGVKGYWVAGKTGTAQIPNPDGGYYEDRQVGSFAGFFPADNPRFAMIVKIDNPKNTQWAESSAAPTFGQMAQWLLSYYRIAPNRNN
ncbi:MAG: penicillin-binding protein 2 [bacterium]|nr:penicillin-binding protein 2 [bacterium]